MIQITEWTIFSFFVKKVFNYLMTHFHLPTEENLQGNIPSSLHGDRLSSIWIGLFQKDVGHWVPVAWDSSDQTSGNSRHILWNITLQNTPYVLLQINDKAPIELHESESHHSKPNKKRQKSSSVKTWTFGFRAETKILE